MSESPFDTGLNTPSESSLMFIQFEYDLTNDRE